MKADTSCGDGKVSSPALTKTEDRSSALTVASGSADRVSQLQAVVNDFVCAGWRECFPGQLAYKAMINPELLDRARALYQPNVRNLPRDE